MIDYIVYLFITFLIYSFLGYVLEVIVCSIEYKKLVNRGFFFGPYCPIYGLGSILIISTLTKYKSDPVVVFFFGVFITACIEYYVSYMLEKIFHNKWWDYSHRKDSINGRICVGNLVGFGVGSLLIIYVTQPLIDNLFSFANKTVLLLIAIFLTVVFVADSTYSIIIAYALRNRIIVAEELKTEKLKMLPALAEKKIKKRVKKYHIKSIRYFRVFPNLKNKYGEELDQIKKWIENNTKRGNRGRK